MGERTWLENGQKENFLFLSDFQKEKKDIGTQELRVMLVLLYALKPFAGHIAKGNKRKTEEFKKAKNPKNICYLWHQPLDKQTLSWFW